MLCLFLQRRSPRRITGSLCCDISPVSPGDHSTVRRSWCRADAQRVIPAGVASFPSLAAAHNREPGAFELPAQQRLIAHFRIPKHHEPVGSQASPCSCNESLQCAVMLVANRALEPVPGTAAVKRGIEKDDIELAGNAIEQVASNDMRIR